jgi:hypothetical protein
LILCGVSRIESHFLCVNTGFEPFVLGQQFNCGPVASELVDIDVGSWIDLQLY